MYALQEYAFPFTFIFSLSLKFNSYSNYQFFTLSVEYINISERFDLFNRIKWPLNLTFTLAKDMNNERTDQFTD